MTVRFQGQDLPRPYRSIQACGGETKCALLGLLPGLLEFVVESGFRQAVRAFLRHKYASSASHKSDVRRGSRRSPRFSAGSSTAPPAGTTRRRRGGCRWTRWDSQAGPACMRMRAGTLLVGLPLPDTIQDYCRLGQAVVRDYRRDIIKVGHKERTRVVISCRTLRGTSGTRIVTIPPIGGTTTRLTRAARKWEVIPGTASRFGPR